MKQRNLACGGVRLSGGCAGACGGVHRAAWRVTSAVPGVVRKADIQFNPPRGSYLVVSRECQLTSPPTGKVNSKPSHRGKVNSNRGKVRQTIYLLQAARTIFVR